jgi:hypothetical protein
MSPQPPRVTATGPATETEPLISSHIDAVKTRMGRIESRFLRTVVELVQQETSGGALQRLRHGLPGRWLRVLSHDVCAPLERDATLELDAGVELLVAIERVLTGGSGAIMSRALAAVASRVLSRSAGLIVPGDMLGTLQHLRAPFEQPFIDAEVRFGARRAAAGFLLEVELSGRPSAAPWLGWAGLGYARAAARFSGANLAEFRFDCRISGSMARVMGSRTATGLIRLPGEAPTTVFPPAPDARPRSAPPRRRSSATNVAAQVEQILSRAPSTPALRSPLDSDGPGVARSTLPPAETARPRLQSGLRPAIRAARRRSRNLAP